MNALNLDPGEDIVLEVRKHWFVFFGTGLFLAIVAVLPLILFGGISRFAPVHLTLPGSISGLSFFIYSLWLLFLWISFFVQWTTYYLDVWYITEKRIIDVEQKHLFSRTVSNLRFDRIQDITVEVEGIIPTFLDMGTIHVQTAAEDSDDFIMRNASHPEKMRDLIFSHHNQESERSMPVTITRDTTHDNESTGTTSQGV
jgi:uncharacterized membrane protein YdbT with pleckstrin-like domain